MRKFLAIAIALAFLGTTGSAFAQRIDDHVIDIGYVGDEKVGQGAGAIPYNWENSPSASYPADANGIPAALDGTKTATKILQVDFVHRVCVYTVTCVTNAPANSMLERLGAGSFMVPGVGQFRAWYGTLTDLNGNAWIDDHNFGTDRIHTSTSQDCGGTAGLGKLSAGDDPNGLGANLGANTGVSLRCQRADEWAPTDLSDTIVAYVTPGNFGGSTDNVNRVFAHFNPLVRPPDPTAAEEPDFSFNHITDSGEATGHYYAPTTNFDYVITDNSLLQTTVVEAIADPKTVSTGARTHEADTGSLVDVDLYSSVDPLVEGLYQTTVQKTLVGAGCNTDLPERGCRKTTDPHTEPIRAEYNKALATAGAETSKFYVGWERDPQNLADRSSAHLYLDIVWEASSSASLVGTHYSSNCADIPAGTWPALGCNVSHTVDGKVHAWPHNSINAIFGIWTDSNGDGWIGTPEYNQDACGNDPYQCGAKQVPHDYTSAEWKDACGSKDVPVAKNADGVFLATVSSSTGKWGNGVYVLTDRYNYNNNQRDTLRDDGRVPFNPYDDLVADAAGIKNPGVPSGKDETGTAGQIESIVTSGDIQVHLICRSQSGFYGSYERLVFLDGTNKGYDITVTGTTTGAFEDLGVPAGETVTDTDVLPAA